MTLYDVIGAPAVASQADLRRAFLRAARRSHPDVHATADAATRQAAEHHMRSLNEAWSVVGDPARRRAYDESLARQRAAQARAHLHARTAGYPPAWAHPYGPAGHAPWPAYPTHPGVGGHSGRPGYAGHPGYPGHAHRTAAGAGPADWRRYASPGPAARRPLGARLATLAPVALVGLALTLASLGLVMGRSPLLSLAGATAVVAGLAFLAAPILAMKEGRRGARQGRLRRRPARAAAARP